MQFVKEIFLLKLGEMVLKGLNRRVFENRLMSNINRRLRNYGEFKVYILQSTVYVEPLSALCDMDGACGALTRIFGIVYVSRAYSCEKNTDAIFQAALAYLTDDLNGVRSFKVESKRADKSFPMTSIRLSQEIGGRLHDALPHLEVDVHNPDYTVYVEVRDLSAYVRGPAIPGAGGLPLGVNGRVAVLLSGGIDSPVAAYMIAKRGVELECIHFFSYPYTSERAKEKVLDLAQILCNYCGRITVNIVPFTKIQEQIRSGCPEELFTILMRRFMMRISEEIAKSHGCKALVTGESLGQVASQTMEAMAVTGAVCTLPVFRPVVGMDKEEIVAIARKIDTYETSILPFEDCCTVFTPKHPKTKPDLAQTEQAERALDVDALVKEAIESVEKVVVRL